MHTVEEISADPEVRFLMENYQGATKQIKAAIQQLSKKEDGLAAMKKILPALRDRKLHVFFSYKKKDEKTASAIVDILRQYGAEKLEITYMADFTEEIAGKSWRGKIRNEVCRANWFILLLPDPSEDWDWCLYETGLFDRQPTSADRLICLHHSDIKIPSAIREYHAVPAKASEIIKFLRMVFVNKNPIPGMDPINKYIEKKLPSIASEIADAIRPPIKEIEHRIYEPYIKLQIENPTDLQNKADLDKALVLEISQEALKIFGRWEKPRTLGELRKGIKESPSNGRWREELFHVIRKITDGRIFTPIQAVFHTQDDKIYRPVAQAIDKVKGEDEIKAFHITFSEEIGALDTSAMPHGVETLATMLRLAFRFRWEVLEKFGKGRFAKKDIARLTNVLQRIEQDAESRGIMEQDVDMSFFLETQQKRVVEMYEYWYTLRDPVGETGELDIALNNKDAKKITAILTKMVPINQEFLEMAATRFSDLVSGKVKLSDKAA